MPEPFVHELRVRYGECDPQGIVFNANYLLYFDVAFTEMWRAAVGPWQEMVAARHRRGRGRDAPAASARPRASTTSCSCASRSPGSAAPRSRRRSTCMRGEELLRRRLAPPRLRLQRPRAASKTEHPPWPADARGPRVASSRAPSTSARAARPWPQRPGAAILAVSGPLPRRPDRSPCPGASRFSPQGARSSSATALHRARRRSTLTADAAPSRKSEATEV